VFRVIGFSKSGTTLFDLKHDEHTNAKYLCKLKADFLVTFLSQISNQAIEQDKSIEYPRRPEAI
jgi:hypothetical protein